MKRGLAVFFTAVMAAVPATGLAAGAHDSMSCTGCHAIHTAKTSSLIFAVDPNTKDVSAKTNQPFGGVTALCLGCHETPEKGGQGIIPISGHMSHPYGLTSVNAKIARVPSELLRDGRFECIGCHDPHPSNTNYKYLRIDTAKGSNMEAFCALCHPMKADPKAAAMGKQPFSSMDERNYAASGSEAESAATVKKTAK